jgi:hypothetical protein
MALGLVSFRHRQPPADEWRNLNGMKQTDAAPEPKSRIGVVQWNALDAGTDGERIVLMVPAFFESHHVPYLTGVLQPRLTELFDDDVELTLQAGRRTKTRSSVEFERGMIVLSGVSRPWPDPLTLRTALEGAFKEAGEIEVQQMRLANELVEHLLQDPG